MADLDLATLAAEIRTLRDMEEVRTLMARYHRACDGTEETGTHRDPRAIAALFTPDGVWEIPGGVIAGREAIAATARQFQAVSWIIHVFANPIVSIGGDTAQAEFKGFVRSRMAPGTPAIWSIGRYDAEFVRGPEGWLFGSLKWAYLDEAETQDSVSDMVGQSVQ